MPFRGTGFWDTPNLFIRFGETTVEGSVSAEWQSANGTARRSLEVRPVACTSRQNGGCGCDCRVTQAHLAVFAGAMRRPDWRFRSYHFAVTLNGQDFTVQLAFTYTAAGARCTRPVVWAGAWRYGHHASWYTTAPAASRHVDLEARLAR